MPINYRPKTAFITGVSGFIGPLVLKDLLSKNYNIVALVLNTNSPVREQLLKIFQKAEIPPAYMDKVKILTGDISEKNLGLKQRTIDELTGTISEVWHLAASLSFRRRDRSKNFLINLEGTKNIVKFAENIGVEYFFHISTVYIRGGESDIVYEEPLQRSMKFTNSYEETKWEAENYVINAFEAKNTKVVIFRPSIVLGDEKYTPEYNFGYYNFLKSLEELKDTIIHLPRVIKWGIRLIGIRIQDDHIYSKIPFPSSSSRSLNLMPVRDLIWLISRISDFHRLQRDAGVSIYNLVDPKPISLQILFQETLNSFKCHLSVISIPGLLLNFFFNFIIISSKLIPQLRSFSKSLFYYKHYILNEVQYDITNTKSIIGEKFGTESLLTPEKLRKAIEGFRQKK